MTFLSERHDLSASSTLSCLILAVCLYFFVAPKSMEAASPPTLLESIEPYEFDPFQAPQTDPETSSARMDRQLLMKELQRARNLMITDPYEGLKVLEENQSQAKQLADTVLGMYYEAKAVYYGISQREDSSLHYLEKALPLYQVNSALQNRTLWMIGMRHFHLGDRDNSMKYLRSALDMATVRNDSFLIATVLGDIGSYLRADNDYDAAAKYLEEALVFAENPKNEKQLRTKYTLTQRMGTLALDQGDNELAIKLFNEVMAFYKGKDNHQYLATLISTAGAYLQLNRLDTAAQTYLRAAKLSSETNNKGFEGFALGMAGRCFATQKKFELAERYFSESLDVLAQTNFLHKYKILGFYMEMLLEQGREKRALEVYNRPDLQDQLDDVDLNTKPYLFTQYAIANLRTGNLERAESLFKEVIILEDSISTMNSEQLAVKIKEKYKTDLLAAEKERLEASNELLELQASSRLRLIILGFGLSFFLIAFIIIYSRMSRQRRIFQEEKISLTTTRNQLLESKASADQEVIRLNEEMVAQQQRELQAHAVQSGQFFEQLDKLDKYLESNDLTGARKHLDRIKRENDFWDKFKDRFIQANPAFMDNLHAVYPDLTRSELEFAALIRSGMSNKELARLFQISEEGIYKRRSRIAKKLNLESSRDLDQALLEIA